MIKIFINNKAILVNKNISILEACEEIGISIPRFCYHERLNVAGNCRMCLVEVEKTPKPIASCAFPILANMKIYTNTPMVRKSRENVLEFLLSNHPLDCPICDQGGECDLQEQSFHFGGDKSRFFIKKRGVLNKYLGIFVKTVMTRCIHCTRCVRFSQDVCGETLLGTFLRGRETEIGSYRDSKLNCELFGNVIDLCPVGALTSKIYAFTARPWEIVSTETIDVNDAVVSNIRVDVKESEVLRILPVLNDSLNDEWISDKTRFSLDGLKFQRLGYPYFKYNNFFLKSKWEKISKVFNDQNSKTKPSEILFICGDIIDFKTAQVLKKISQNLGFSLVSETFFDIENTLMSNVKFNITFNDMLKSDLCLTIGTNVRFEASLLNVRIKKRTRQSVFRKASIGLAENLTYQNDDIGNSINTLIKIAEGRHSFCKSLISSKTPCLILGAGIKKRFDTPFIKNLLNLIIKHTKILDKKWFGINFLPLSAGSVGRNFLGLNFSNTLSIKQKKTFFFIGLGSYDNFLNKIPKKGFIITQTPFSDTFLINSNLILPSTSFIEKETIFINLEGRAQQTFPVLPMVASARHDELILKTIFTQNFKKDSFREVPVSSKIFNDWVKNKITFTKNLFLFQTLIPGKAYKTSYKISLSNFYITNAITKNSLIMAKSFLAQKQKYRNFI